MMYKGIGARGNNTGADSSSPGLSDSGGARGMQFPRGQMGGFGGSVGANRPPPQALYNNRMQGQGQGQGPSQMGGQFSRGHGSGLVQGLKGLSMGPASHPIQKQYGNSALSST